MSTMDIKAVLARLPHRYPFVMVDRVLELEPGERIKAVKNVTINEPFFPGHFPGHPVMPGVMIIEAMAQAAAILVMESIEAAPDVPQVVYFVGIDNARFKRPVVPGDQLVLTAHSGRHLRGIWKCSAEAHVDGVQVAGADLMCTIRPA